MLLKSAQKEAAALGATVADEPSGERDFPN